VSVEPQEASPNRARWRALLAVAAAAVLTVVLADVLLARVSKVVKRREVEEATADHAASDPTVLVLGSSHARTFITVDKVLGERTGGRERVLTVPVEWGKYRSYEWVLNHRVRPYIEETTASGELKRKKLRRFILLTAWWDACALDGDPPVFNLPSRAWQLGDFLRDVWANGLTPYSRNYVSTRFLRLFHDSILVADRGKGRVFIDLRQKLLPMSDEALAFAEAGRMDSWREIMTRGEKCLFHPDEMAALGRILDWAKARGYETTVIAYPMIPKSITADTRRLSLDRFSAGMAELMKQRGLPYHDYTTSSPLTDDDFEADFDHLNPRGDAKLTRFWLDGDLKFLETPVPVPVQEQRL
jgi:hypothetical protein